jgi:hypothetical protein
VYFTLQGEVEQEEEEEGRDPGDKKYTSSLAGASMNFINSIIGSGIIGTLYCTKNVYCNTP